MIEIEKNVEKRKISLCSLNTIYFIEFLDKYINNLDKYIKTSNTLTIYNRLYIIDGLKTLEILYNNMSISCKISESIHIVSTINIYNIDDIIKIKNNLLKIKTEIINDLITKII